MVCLLELFRYIILLCASQMIQAAPPWLTPAARLKCLTCVPAADDTTQLDQFRVRQRLPEPQCEMEPVECAPQQDACVTVTMQVGDTSLSMVGSGTSTILFVQVAPKRFWIGSGCDQRVNYDIPADQDGCAELQTFTRNFQPGYMEERQAIQRVCLCTGQLCNYAARRSLSLLVSVVLILTYISALMLH